MFHEGQYFYFCFSKPYSSEENINGIFTYWKKYWWKWPIVAFLEKLSLSESFKSFTFLKFTLLLLDILSIYDLTEIISNFNSQLMFCLCTIEKYHENFINVFE